MTIREPVLIVDDAATNIDLLVDLLAPDYELFIATDGPSALEIAKTQELSIILLDVMMPGMDGYEVCKRLKDSPATQTIPVIFLTAMSEDSSESHGLELGAVDYITKPFNPALVKARVQTHLALFRSANDLRTERNRLAEAYINLQRLEKLRDNLVQMIVHDLRSPLSGIYGNIDLAIEFLKSNNQEGIEFLKSAKEAAQDLNEMVSTVLDYSRLEAGAMPVCKSPIDLVELASTAVARLRNWKGEKRNIGVHTSSGSLIANCDPALTERVIVNLVSNALKFTPAQGSIDVSISLSDGFACIEVADTGYGIPSEFHKKIFEKFGQVENGIHSKKHSTGIGLTFCKLALEAMNGSISLASEVGKGTTFTVMLPT